MCNTTVTINYEDAEQVERLELGMRDAAGWSSMCSDQRISALTIALREFANPTPPKPDEPTGLGAVVEDVTHDLWVRTLAEGKFGKPWRSESRQRNDGWQNLDAVRVVSEGVQP